jgi:uncharacterized membrane protein
MVKGSIGGIQVISKSIKLIALLALTLTLTYCGSKTNNTTTTASFASINSTILQSSCVSCHAGASPSAGLDLSTFAKVTASSNIVNTASPAASKFYTRTLDQSMPQGGTPLSESQLQAILDWITAGAKND